LIEGDGIGPEIAVAVKDIFAAAKVRSLASAHPDDSIASRNNY
jgi:isocitrate/isopropylmalate dehydrogenase